MQMMHRLLQPVDNSALVLFRMLFGFLVMADAVGAMATGWVHEIYVEPSFTFHFFGFAFLQHLVGPQMYVVYVMLSVAGILVMLGWRYRFSAVLLAVLWSITYLNQKEHYNNHYYLIFLISWIMPFLPAHVYASLDVWSGRVQRKVYCSWWEFWLLPGLVAIVYFYAAIAKLYPDWMQGIPVSIWFTANTYESIFWGHETAEWLRSIFYHNHTHLFFSWAGIFFDLLVIPAFLWRRTRTLALMASLFFHLMNSAIFHIGVFPYFALSFVVFFYPAEKVRRLFLRKKPAFDPSTAVVASKPSFGMYMAVAFMAWQVLLPLRHWLIPGDVLWTEEGHRLSWRMMLRTKSAMYSIAAVNAATGEREWVDVHRHMTEKQVGNFRTRPDMVWHFAQWLEKHYREERGWDEVEVYADIQVSVNGKPYRQFVDPEFDLTSVKWKYFGHQSWLLD